MPLVKGIQLGAGLSLMINAGNQLAPTSWTVPWQDNYVWLIFAAVTLCFTSRSTRFPYALIVFTLGSIFLNISYLFDLFLLMLRIYISRPCTLCHQDTEHAASEYWLFPPAVLPDTVGGPAGRVFDRRNRATTAYDISK